MLKYLELIRVNHWVKNLFVFAGVFFAGKIFTNSMLDALLVFVSFCFASSIVYVINDLNDINRDKKHPRKKNRPLPSGRVSKEEAYVVLGLVFAAFIVSLVYVNTLTRLIVTSYIVLNFAYSLVLKNIVLIDVFTIALGFILRVLAGTVGIEIYASPWFIVTIISLSLFLGFSKRFNEKMVSGKDHRKSLEDYDFYFLSHLTLVSATLSLAFYSLYVIETNPSIAYIATILLAMYGFFRYLYIIYVKREGGDPIIDIIRDKPLLITLVLYAIIIFLGNKLI